MILSPQAAFNSPLKPLIGGATDHKKSTTTQPDSVDCSVTPPPIKAQPMNYIDEDNNLLMMCDDKERLRYASKSVENITLTLNGERIQLDPMSGAMFNKKRLCLFMCSTITSEHFILLGAAMLVVWTV